jgi:hypothetical protein
MTAPRIIEAWIAGGVSWKGDTVLRDASGRPATRKNGGRSVTCGHHHKTRKSALPCGRRMRLERPGNCGNYHIQRIAWIATGTVAARIA